MVTVYPWHEKRSSTQFDHTLEVNGKGKVYPKTDHEAPEEE